MKERGDWKKEGEEPKRVEEQRKKGDKIEDKGVRGRIECVGKKK